MINKNLCLLLVLILLLSVPFPAFAAEVQSGKVLSISSTMEISGRALSGSCEWRKTGDGYSVAVNLTNNGSKETKGSILLSAYDASGRMLALQSCPFQIAAAGFCTEDLIVGTPAAESLALFVVSENGIPLTDSCRLETRSIAEAWYEINDGSLYIRTNIDASHWEDGYSGAICTWFSDGSRDIDRQSGYGGNVTFGLLTLPYQDDGTVTEKVDYIVFDSYSGGREFFDLFDNIDYWDDAAKIYTEHVVARFTLDTPLMVRNGEEPLTLRTFRITYSEDGTQETYTAVLDEALSDEGEYALLYRGETGNWNAGMSHIAREGDVLTFTQEAGHFANAGSTGYFTIVHSSIKAQDDGSIACIKSTSNSYFFSFEK